MSVRELGTRVALFVSGVIVWELIGVATTALLSFFSGRMLLSWSTVLVGAPLVGFFITLAHIAVTRSNCAAEKNNSGDGRTARRSPSR